MIKLLFIFWGKKTTKNNAFSAWKCLSKWCVGLPFLFLLMWCKNVRDWKNRAGISMEINEVSSWEFSGEQSEITVQDCKIEKLFHATWCRTLVAWGLLPIWAGSGWYLSWAASRARASLSETPLLHMSWGSLAAENSLLLAPCIPSLLWTSDSPISTIRAGVYRYLG